MNGDCSQLINKEEYRRERFQTISKPARFKQAKVHMKKNRYWICFSRKWMSRSVIMRNRNESVWYIRGLQTGVQIPIRVSL